MENDDNLRCSFCGGTFTGLEKIIQRRRGSRVMGFGAKFVPDKKTTGDNILKSVQAEDLLLYGFISEFLGRLPVIAPFPNLDEEALVRILTEPRNALIRQFQRLLEMSGFDLSSTIGALQAIAREAMTGNSGARGLRAIVERCLLDTMHELPSIEKPRGVS